jgi:hypothetical protein
MENPAIRRQCYEKGADRRVREKQAPAHLRAIEIKVVWGWGVTGLLSSFPAIIAMSGYSHTGMILELRTGSAHLRTR